MGELVQQYQLLKRVKRNPVNPTDPSADHSRTSMSGHQHSDADSEDVARGISVAIKPALECSAYPGNQLSVSQ